MIGAATADALARIAARAQDVLHAYEAGFEPAERDAAAVGAPRAIPTADALSVVAPQDAFFLFSDAAGAMHYGRDGSFTLLDGTLRAADGSAVLGSAADGTGPLAPLTADPIDRALGRVTRPGIDADGSVAYTRMAIDPRTGERRGERVVIGRLALARFPAGTLPVRAGATRVIPPRGVAPHVGAPGDRNFAPLATFARDPGRIDVVAGLARLQDAYLTFEAIQAAQHARGGTEKTAMDLVK